MYYQIGFHAWFHTSDAEEDLQRKMNAWVSSEAFVPQKNDTFQRGNYTLTLKLGTSAETKDAPQIVAWLRQSEPEEEWHFLPDLLLSFCEQLEPHLLRCSPGDDLDYLRAEELDGNLSSVGFFLYLSPGLVQRFGKLRLLVGPFWRVCPLGNGGCGIQSHSGLDANDGAIFRSAQAYLGIAS